MAYTYRPTTIAQALDNLTDENRHTERALIEGELETLRRHLRREWEYNHAERCGKPWPHDGECYWPPPS